MHATKERVESDTSTVYSISLYESKITNHYFTAFRVSNYPLLMREGATTSYRLSALQSGQFRCQSVDSGPIEKG